MEKKVDKKGVVQEYSFGKNIRVHRDVCDTENWCLTAMDYGYNKESICSIKADEQRIFTATLMALLTRQQQLTQDIKDISELMDILY